MNILLNRLTLWALAIMLITLVVYIPAMTAGFIWDDDLFLTKNPLIKADDGIYRFWFTTEPPDYFPLVSSSLWLEWRLWGMNPTGYHVVNIVLHAMSSVLLWLVLKRLDIPGAWLAGLFFAVHPVNVESVAWITERKNTMPMVFYLLSILSYLKFESEGRKRLYLFSLLSFLLSLLSKPSGVMLPFVLLGCAWWQRDEIVRKDIIRSIPFFALSLVLGLTTIWFQYNVAIGEDIVRTDGFFSRLAGAGWAVWFYLYKVIFPFNLSFVYPRWEINTFSIFSYLPAIMILGCFLLFWWYRRNMGKALLFAFGYFVVTLFPVLGFFNIHFMIYSFVADHWQYTSIVGIIALIVGIGTWLLEKWKNKLGIFVTVAPVILVGIFCLLTWSRCHVFWDEVTLWRDTIAKNPKSWLAHGNLGVALSYNGKYEEAFSHLSFALQMKPNHAKLHGAMGITLVGLDRQEEAIHHFSEAVRLKPDFVEAHFDLGLALALRERYKEAIHHFSEAVRLKPKFAEAHYNLGLALIMIDNKEKALSSFSEAVRLKPDFVEAHYNLGNLLAQKKQLKEAITHFSEALRIRPDFKEAKQNLSQALSEAQIKQEVIRQDQDK